MIDDIATFLAAQSTSFTLLAGTGGNLAKEMMWDSTRAPDTMTVLYEQAGVGNQYTFSTATGRARVAIENPGLQILSRSTLAKTARANAQAAYQLLDGIGNRNLPTTTGPRYLSIEAVQAPFFSGRDENDRFVYSTNYLVSKSISPSGGFDSGFDEGFL